MLMAFLRKSDKFVIFICLSFRGEINLYKCRWNRRGNPRAKNPKSPLSQTNFANLKCAFVCPCTLYRFKACFCMSLLNFVILSLSLQNFVNSKCAFVCYSQTLQIQSVFCLSLSNFVILSLSLQNFANSRCVFVCHYQQSTKTLSNRLTSKT